MPNPSNIYNHNKKIDLFTGFPTGGVANMRGGCALPPSPPPAIGREGGTSKSDGGGALSQDMGGAYSR